MIDDLVRKFTILFEKYGDPTLNLDKYNLSESELNLFKSYYLAYSTGVLRQSVAAGGQIPRVKVSYNGNIDDLISKINSSKDLDSKMVIYVSNEINDINHLNKLKETFPNKEIVIKWNNELSFIDDVISAVYMIDYYKSVIDDNLSPLEKVTMAYDVVKSHYYKEYDVKHTVKSRNITEMVNNDYIVCRGYVNIFNRLLKEMGIDASFLELSINLNDEEIHHSRSFVKINDEKYNVNGLFVFDPTWDSSDKEHYYQFDGNNAKYNKGKKEGYQKADSLSAYIYYLVPLSSYESKFSNSHDEIIFLPNNKKVDDNLTKRLLHTNQKEDSKLPVLQFVNLLYNVKLAEGYNINDIPKLIQESLYVSGYGYYKLEAINGVLDSINNNVSVGRSRGYIRFNFFCFVVLFFLLVFIIYCFFR